MSYNPIKLQYTISLFGFIIFNFIFDSFNWSFFTIFSFSLTLCRSCFCISFFCFFNSSWVFFFIMLQWFTICNSIINICCGTFSWTCKISPPKNISMRLAIWAWFKKFSTDTTRNLLFIWHIRPPFYYGQLLTAHNPIKLIEEDKIP